MEKNVIRLGKVMNERQMKNVTGGVKPATCIVCCGPCGIVNVYNSSDCGAICGSGSWMCHEKC